MRSTVGLSAAVVTRRLRPTPPRLVSDDGVVDDAHCPLIGCIKYHATTNKTDCISYSPYFCGFSCHVVGALPLVDMPYDLIKRAIQERRSMTAVLETHIRHFSPHVLGRNADARPLGLGFQYGGARRLAALPPEGDWLLFGVSDLRDLTFNNDPWHPGPVGRPRPNWIMRIELQA
jgi:hypothetical protein